MATDYQKINIRNKEEYAAERANTTEFLSNLYANSTHFIFELLQNAEDALARNQTADYSRTVTFNLSENELRFSHFGGLFTEKDFKAISRPFQSTKVNTNAIGKFGIGFKSVFKYTDRPEIHSGDEHFAIEKNMDLGGIPSINSEPGQTTFILPFKSDVATAFDDIKYELSGLEPSILLFLRQIEEVCWTIEDGRVGKIRRSVEDCVLKGARQVRLSGSDSQGAQISQTWIVFSREVEMPDCPAPGCVEIAFLVVNADNDKSLTVNRLSTSPLMVYFPTAVETNLGFLMQGPYQTTPSRDNIAENDWNAYLIKETAALLVTALREFRDEALLDAAMLMTLPIDHQRFSNGNMFEPLFSQVVDALNSESLIPTPEGLYVSGKAVRIPEFVSLGKLFNSSQLTQLSCKSTRDAYAYSLFSEPKLIDEGEEISWLSEDISPEATPELFQFFRVVLDIPIVKSETLLCRLRPSFLQEQTDAWMIQLYTFLLGRFSSDFIHSLPIIRCEDGSHLEPYQNGKPQVYLPSDNWTGFPTIKRSLVKEEYIANFLKQIGISEPDLVDDVVQNVLPKYSSEYEDIDDSAYVEDISLILAAWGTDSRTQKEKLREALQESFFVRAVDTGTGGKQFAKPGDVYMATSALKELFGGVDYVLIVDDSVSCMKGEAIRSVLESCGVSRFLRIVKHSNSMDYLQRGEIRRASGDLESRVYNQNDEDWTIHGLDSLLIQLSDLSGEDAIKKSSLLWKALAGLKAHSFFTGKYTWQTNWKYKTVEFDSSCAKLLKQVRWVPDESWELQIPAQVEFDVAETFWGWERNEVLQECLSFKPSIIKELEKEAGLEPGLVAFLKSLNLTTRAELEARFKVVGEEQDEKAETEGMQVIKTITATGKETSTLNGKTRETNEFERPLSKNKKRAAHDTSRIYSSRVLEETEPQFPAGSKVLDKDGKPSQFVSYLAVSHIEEQQDPDGLELEERLQLEEQALKLIIDKEPELKRTPVNNPGFDLYENGPDGNPIKWIEVKSMTKSLKDRPVGISRTQFHAALNHGEDYWLYVVEYVSETDKARIIRIQDPAGKAFTFTFDFGWLDVADID